MLPALARARESARRSSCQNNLKQWGLVFKMYANESKGGRYPPMQTYIPTTQRRALAAGPQLDLIYPEYLTDPYITICPSDAKGAEARRKIESVGGNMLLVADLIDDSYIYLGWVFDDLSPAVPLSYYLLIGLLISLNNPDIDTSLPVPVQFGGVFDALYYKHTQSALDYLDGSDPTALLKVMEEDANLDYPGSYWRGYGNAGSNVIYRLREGIERFLITDINAIGNSVSQSEIWIMMDTISLPQSKDPLFNHVPGGCNVLYMDGHVEFVRYIPDPNPYDTIIVGNQPVTSSMANIVTAISESVYIYD
ncbi:MAG: DUF1559 domain-containing protein [Candidatus Hydrogenedentes bacterium]|nr:DUF1559 domain-containing protein [Candidatus Hydrogenedentota bacterium]